MHGVCVTFSCSTDTNRPIADVVQWLFISKILCKISNVRLMADFSCSMRLQRVPMCERSVRRQHRSLWLYWRLLRWIRWSQLRSRPDYNLWQWAVSSGVWPLWLLCWLYRWFWWGGLSRSAKPAVWVWQRWLYIKRISMRWRKPLQRRIRRGRLWWYVRACLSKLFIEKYLCKRSRHSSVALTKFCK